MSFHETEMDYLELLCSKKKLSIDIGVNHGSYLEKLIPLSLETIGFEPNHELILELQSNFKDAKIMPYALSNKEGKLDLNIPLYSENEKEYYIRAMGSLNDHIFENKNFIDYKKIEVEVKTLDSFCYQNVGFIKIDVEGHEIEVIKGGLRTISEQKPNLLIEIEERHRKGAISYINNLMKDIGYNSFFIYKNKIHPYSEFNLEKYQNNPLKKVNYKAVKVPNYVNNFIFMK